MRIRLYLLISLYLNKIDGHIELMRFNESFYKWLTEYLLSANAIGVIRNINDHRNIYFVTLTTSRIPTRMINRYE